jgi:hypothetical protein
MRLYGVQWETRKIGSIGQFHYGSVHIVEAESREQAIELARQLIDSEQIETRAVECWERD